MIIFDCDGVLVDSEILSCETDARYMTNAGFPISQTDLLRRFIGRPKRAIWDAIAQERGAPWPEGLMDQASEELQRRIAAELQPVDGIAAALEQIGLPRAVASSSGVEKLKLSIKRCGLGGFFGQHVYSTEQVARGKPAPDVFLLAASQLGADPADCLVVEDSAAGVTAARRAGMQALGFTGGLHTWPEHETWLREAGAIDVIAHMRELPQWIAEFRPNQ